MTAVKYWHSLFLYWPRCPRSKLPRTRANYPLLDDRTCVTLPQAPCVRARSIPSRFFFILLAPSRALDVNITGNRKIEGLWNRLHQKTCRIKKKKKILITYFNTFLLFLTSIHVQRVDCMTAAVKSLGCQSSEGLAVIMDQRVEYVTSSTEI